MEVKLEPDCISHCTDSNSVNGTQIRVRMLKLLLVKVLDQLGQVAVLTRQQIGRISAHGI